jgi:cellulose synthase/poly-beta-1,6-N-acetylglucosamine synthase-like glycosyltransferase
MILAIASTVALLLIWGGYPLAIRLAAVLSSPGPSPARDPGSGVSVLLATNADAESIRSRVANLLAGSYPAHLLEIVVSLDARSSAATLHDLNGLDARVHVVSGDSPGGKAASLNAAARAATGDVLVFADTAQRFDTDAIGELVRALAAPGVGAVSGHLVLAEEGEGFSISALYWRYERWLRAWEGRVASTIGVTGAIYAMRRELWVPLPAGLILDDVYVPMRLVLDGWRVGFTTAARAVETRRFKPTEEQARKTRTLTGIFQVCAWLPGVLSPLRNPVWSQFVFHKLLRFLTPYLALVFLVSGGWMLLRSPARVAVWLMLGAGLAAILLVPRARRAARTQLAWGFALQVSVIAATINGLRGRWDVWR